MTRHFDHAAAHEVADQFAEHGVPHQKVHAPAVKERIPVGQDEVMLLVVQGMVLVRGLEPVKTDAPVDGKQIDHGRSEQPVAIGKQKMLDAGANGIITKPFPPEELQKVIGPLVKK